MDKRESLLIFVHKNSARKAYVFSHVFSHILRVPYQITSKLEDFVAYNGPKFSYIPNRLGHEFHIRDTGFLDEKGIRNDFIPQTDKWDNVTVLFPVKEEASMPFDLFSGIFYFLSRYEEYTQQDTDEHGRFGFEKSLAFRLGFLDQPLIEIWLDLFKKKFEEKFEDYRFPLPSFRFNPIMSISISHLYKYKGIVRHSGGIVESLFTLKWKNLWNRLKFGFFSSKDPYDTFDEIIRLKKTFNHPLTSFFLVGNYSHFDHNVSPLRPALKKTIVEMADYSDVGLLVSYYASEDLQKFKWEKQRLEEIIHKPVNKTLFHFFKIKIPESYIQLWQHEIKEDYTMGFARKEGFRASTSHPFYFYDLEEENVTDLLVYPVPVTDYQLNFHHPGIQTLPPAQRAEKAWETIHYYGNIIKRYGGWFLPVFHNAVLSDFEEWSGWTKVYKQTIETFSEK